MDKKIGLKTLILVSSIRLQAFSKVIGQYQRKCFMKILILMVYYLLLFYEIFKNVSKTQINDNKMP